ncbi:MAG TPA: L,D-transpeptidase [Gemmatimonadaceae bacterium]|nr:L,D-transpeptidase [Gemmatimonadaceae bacterium]
MTDLQRPGLLKAVRRIFGDNLMIAIAAVGVTAAVLVASTAIVVNAMEVRYRRDIHRIGFNSNWDLLDEVRTRLGLEHDSLETVLASSPEPGVRDAYLVISLADRRLWYRRGDETIYTTRVAVGSGKSLVQAGTRKEWKFDTPRGRLLVQSKEMDPVWVPPDWHFVELARKRGLGVVRLVREKPIAAGDGSVVTVSGNAVVRQYPDGRVEEIDVREDREIVVGGNVVIPPFGTNQRRYSDVLGTHRLNLGDGYALHGTNKPESIGQAVSHGCVRLRNEDIAFLYGAVEVGTPVYIY